MFYLRQAVILDSSAARAYINLSDCFEAEGLPDSAVLYAQKALLLEPANPVVVSRLGRAFAALGYVLHDTDSASGRVALTSAEVYLNQALELDSARADALVELASINLFLDRVDSSMVCLARLERHLYPPPGELHLLGDRYAFKQRRDLAVRAYRLAIHNGLNVVVANALRGKYFELRDESG
jgi:tetratricopeptide (TPR) repeat protein